MPILAKKLFNETSACEQASRWAQSQMFSHPTLWMFMGEGIQCKKKYFQALTLNNRPLLQTFLVLKEISLEHFRKDL